MQVIWILQRKILTILNKNLIGTLCWMCMTLHTKNPMRAVLKCFHDFSSMSFYFVASSQGVYLDPARKPDITSLLPTLNAILSSPQPDDAISGELIEFLGYDEFELTTEILQDRTTLVEEVCTGKRMSFSRLKLTSISDVRLKHTWLNSKLLQYKRTSCKNIFRQVRIILVLRAYFVAESYSSRPSAWPWICSAENWRAATGQCQSSPVYQDSGRSYEHAAYILDQPFGRRTCQKYCHMFILPVLQCKGISYLNLGLNTCFLWAQHGKTMR